MDTRITDVLQACTDGSDQEAITFPHIIGQLLGVGVERYHADLCRRDKTYYLPSGESFVTPCRQATAEIATAFSAAGVEAAVRASQAGQIRYHEFCRRVMAAGCVGYVVSLAGRRAVYHGRTGEMHVEHFPSAKA